MNHLPVIALFFMSAVICNCLRMLQNYSAALTLDVLTMGAVTGYGAQGASAEYVIALEGTEGARQRMSGMRAFYISISRAVDHVQIYTDGMADWMTAIGKN